MNFSQPIVRVTALKQPFEVTNDFLTAMDTGKVSVLSHLDLSAAFDTVDHDILLHRLEHTFGFQGELLHGSDHIFQAGHRQCL